MTRKRWLDTLYCPRMQTKRLVFAREGPSMTFHSRPWCNRGAYISDIADASKSVRVRNDEENDNTLRLRMLVIARIKSNLIYPRAVLRMTATDKRGVGSIRTGVETGFMRESFFASIRPLAAGHLQCVSCSPARRFCTTRMNSWKGLIKRKVWRHVTMVAKFLDFNNISWQRWPFALSNDGRNVWVISGVMDRKFIHVHFFFFSAIFAGPQFVEIQKFCDHGNVT